MTRPSGSSRKMAPPSLRPSPRRESYPVSKLIPAQGTWQVARRRQTVEPLRKSPPRTSPAIPLRIRLRWFGPEKKGSPFCQVARGDCRGRGHSQPGLRRGKCPRRWPRYAALCQEAGLTPAVEPEVLVDGEHSLERSFDVTEEVLRTFFNQLYAQRVLVEGMILTAQAKSGGRVADATVKCR